MTQRTIASGMEEFEFNAAYELAVLEHSAAFLSRFDAQRDCAWMAERDGVVVGWVLVERVDAKVARLSMLHVESQARGIGIGRRLIAEAIQSRRGRLCDVAGGVVRPDEDGATAGACGGFNHTGSRRTWGMGGRCTGRCGSCGCGCCRWGEGSRWPFNGAEILKR